MIQANPLGILLALIFISSLSLLFSWMFRVPPPVPLSVARVHRSIASVHRILIPIIEAIPSERAVELACRLANGKKAELILVHVMEVPYTMPLNAPVPAQEKRAREALELGVLIGQQHGCHVQTQIIRHRNAADGILETARAENVDAILLGVGLKARVPGEWGKTAVAVLNRATCEVIVDKVPITAQPLALYTPAKSAPSDEKSPEQKH